MFKLDCNKNIFITAGDSGFLKVIVPNYKMKDTDTVKLSVSSKKADGEEHKKIEYLFQEVARIEEGAALIDIKPDDTKGAEPGTYLYDIELTNINRDVFTIVTPRKFEIMGGITND